MQRNQLIQSLIDKHKFNTYLEIGVREGHVFFLIRCRNKIAIDPEFSFNLTQYIKKYLSLLNGGQFFELTSDNFFTNDAEKVLLNKKIDIVLVDGMHEMDFALRDILNSLKYLSDDGFIIVHDCNPSTEDRACSFNEWKARNYEGVWNGDVWKSILYLIRNRPDLDIFTIDTDNGLGVIRKNKRHVGMQGRKADSIDSVREISFHDLGRNRREFLNLIDITEAKRILNF